MRFDTLLRHLRAVEARVIWERGERPRLKMPQKVQDRLLGDLVEHREDLRAHVAARLVEVELGATEIPVGWWRSPIYSQAHLIVPDTAGDLIAWCGRPLPGEWRGVETSSGRCATCRRMSQSRPPPWWG